MATTKTSLLCNRFGGIRKRSATFSSELITCSDCQNIELFYTGVNSGVGIRTAKGNSKLLEIGENIVNMFESVQNGTTYCFLHTETETAGSIYKYDIGSNTKELIYTGLSITGKSSGVTVAQGWIDQFIFSNGEEILNIQIGRTSENGEAEDVKALVLKDRDDRVVKGLGLITFDGRLWIFNKNVLWYSRQENYSDFSTNDPDTKTNAGYIEFVQDITAIYNYLGSVAVFHSDCSTLISLESDSTFSRGDDSPGGCASYNSLVFHGTELYFFDNTKKGVFCFKQVVNGDKTLGDNVAIDVQDLLMDIDLADLHKIKTLSVVTSEKNEIWFLLPSKDSTYSTILIFDYICGEWVKRKSNKLNCLAIIEGKILSAGSSIFEEYIGYKFNNTFIPSYYNCSIMNLGADNTLKILYFPPRVTMDMTRSTEFFVKYIKNYNYLKSSREKLIKTKTIKNALYWNVGNWGVNYWASENSTVIYKLSSATFKSLEIEFFTAEEGQEFSIMNIEFSKIKVKQV